LILKKTKFKKSVSRKKYKHEHSSKKRRKNLKIFTTREKKLSEELNNYKTDAYDTTLDMNNEFFDGRMKKFDKLKTGPNSYYFDFSTNISIALIIVPIEAENFDAAESDLENLNNILEKHSEEDQLLTQSQPTFKWRAEKRIFMITFDTFDNFTICKPLFICESVFKRLLSPKTPIGKKKDYEGYEGRTEAKLEYENMFLTRRAAKELSGLFLRSLGFKEIYAKIAGYLSNIGPHSRCTNWPLPQRALTNPEVAPKLEVMKEYWKRPCSTFTKCRSESSALPPVIGNGFRCIRSNYKIRTRREGDDVDLKNLFLGKKREIHNEKERKKITIFLQTGDKMKATRVSEGTNIHEIAEECFGKQDWSISHHGRIISK
jgi:hypothetical protein